LATAVSKPRPFHQIELGANDVPRADSSISVISTKAKVRLRLDRTQDQIPMRLDPVRTLIAARLACADPLSCHSLTKRAALDAETPLRRARRDMPPSTA
jgi:hypothetical protein